MHETDPWDFLGSAKDEQIPLLWAALMIARDEYTGLDVDAYLDQCNGHVRELARSTSHVEDPIARVRLVNEYLFDTQGFAGNFDDYYDPRNSYLNEVFDRRLGIPITLAIVYLEISRRLGLSLQGVSFPGHFLVRMPVDDGLVVLDPFLRGRSLDLDELRQLAKPHVGDAAHEDGVMSKLLAPASNRDILSRMLRNLKVVYLDRQDTERALRCSDRLIRLNPGSAIDYRARGEIYRQLGHASAAQADLRRCLELDAEIDEADTIRDQLVELAGKRTALN